MLATSSNSSSGVLNSYTKLKPLLLNTAWSSEKVCAIIAPSLSYPLLLRKPFLLANSIVIDHAAHSCTVKKNTNVDLLGPLPVHVPPPCPFITMGITLMYMQVGPGEFRRVRALGTA